MEYEVCLLLGSAGVLDISAPSLCLYVRSEFVPCRPTDIVNSACKNPPNDSMSLFLRPAKLTLFIVGP